MESYLSDMHENIFIRLVLHLFRKAVSGDFFSPLFLLFFLSDDVEHSWFSRLMAARYLCTWLQYIGVCFFVVVSWQSSRTVESDRATVGLLFAIFVIDTLGLQRTSHGLFDRRAAKSSFNFINQMRYWMALECFPFQIVKGID